MSKAFEIIAPHPTWEIIDPSKLTTYMECPRKYFYEYVLGWRSDYPNNHLVFGSAWHVAVEHLLRNGYTSEELTTAKLLFLTSYREELPESTDDLYTPKRPADAFNALDLYFDQFRNDLSKYEVCHTEVEIIVSIGETEVLHGKIDAILKEKESNQYLIMDHKTSKQKSANWEENWKLSTQILTYLHALYSRYPREEVKGAIVRGSFFYKAKPHAFHEADIVRNPDHMQSWLDDVEYWYSALQFDMERLAECSDDAITMEAFPKNSTSCNNWGGCTYTKLCTSWGNPLPKCDRWIPEGIKVEYWDPREIPTIRETMDLTQKEEENDTE